jgi:ABC-type branched-subunit amino acid transport system substrate-binding protein
MSLTPRHFLRAIALVSCALVALSAAGPWHTAIALDDGPAVQRVLRIGHVVSAMTDTSESESALGLRLGLEEAQHAGRLFGVVVEMVTDNDADRLVRQHRPNVIIGGSTADACVRLGELAAAEGTLFFNIGCASNALRGAACRRNTFHIAASERMRNAALAQANAATGKAEVLLWHESLERYGAGQLNPRFRDRFEKGMGSDAWTGWMAVKIASETCFRATTCAASELLAALERPTTRFDGHKGRPLSFRLGDHQLRQPLYVLRNDDPSREIIEVPERTAGSSAADQLDQLGASGAESSCTLEKR